MAGAIGTGLGASTADHQAQAAADTGAPGAPLNLRCEYRVNPLGIDIQPPRLSWVVNDPRRGAAQTAYQIIVSTDPAMTDADKVVWDTGKVASDQSIHVAYAGTPLRSSTRYTWKVRTWDTADQVSPDAEPAWWEMGLLEPGDWSGRWITSETPASQEEQPDLSGAKWIWNAKARGDNKTAWFRARLDIDADATIESAVVKMTADDGYVVFANGKRVGHNDVWNVLGTYQLTETLRPGQNLIAVRAWNGSGPAGLLMSLRVKLRKGQNPPRERGAGKVIDLVTGDKWRTSATDAQGWESLEFNDAGWDPAEAIASYGDDPWKDVRDPPLPRQSLCMRKAFKVGKPIARARAYVSGLGNYVLRLNGQRVGDDVFTPGWTHYYKRIQYQTYDVTDMLRQGENAVGAILGNGWWSGGLGWAGAGTYSEGNLRLILQLKVEYTDGTSDTMVTDEAWKAQRSPITRNTYYHGETYDARLEMPGWDAAGFDDAKWWDTVALSDPVDLLAAQRCETIRVTEELTDPQISEPDSGVYLFDFRQNASGRCRLKVTGAEPGTMIRLRFGEELDPNGRLYRDNYRSAEATDYYICKGGEEAWEPIFTYRGFRYCEVTGLPKPPTRDTLVFRVLHTATPAAGTFDCSNWLINQILSNVNWGLRSNLHSVPTDCPQRDERLGWMGDAQAFAHTSCFLRDMGSFYSKWMFDITDSQSPEGAVTDVAPAKVVKGAAKPGWGDAVVVIPYTVYRFYGDTRVIEENYDAMVGWVEYMRGQSKDDLYEEKGYGDWVPVQESPSEWIGSAYYFYSTKLLSEMAAAIGKADDAGKYADLAERIAAAFNRKHLNEKTNNYVTGTQTCNILPLYFGITPEDRREAVLANVVKDIEARGDHLSTGFLGTTYLMALLSDHGQDELAYRLATQSSYPSWGYMIRKGATTIWERWDTDKRGPEMNSRNHFAFGTVARWFYEQLAGINLDPDVPGFKRFIIRPRVLGDLCHARGEYPSIHGTIRSAWRRAGDGLTLDVTIPANTGARVFVPTLGLKRYLITEGGTPMMVPEGGVARRIPGVEVVDVQPDAAVLEVDAGTYAFAVLPQ